MTVPVCAAFALDSTLDGLVTLVSDTQLLLHTAVRPQRCMAPSLAAQYGD